MKIISFPKEKQIIQNISLPNLLKINLSMSDCIILNIFFYLKKDTSALYQISDFLMIIQFY